MSWTLLSFETRARRETVLLLHKLGAPSTKWPPCTMECVRCLPYGLIKSTADSILQMGMLGLSGVRTCWTVS